MKYLIRKRNLSLYERDNLLVHYIREHKGKANIVSAKEISNYLKANGYNVKARYVNTVIVKLMYERSLPICSLNSKGYFWGANRAEIEEAIKHLQSRCVEITKHIEHLQSFILN